MSQNTTAYALEIMKTSMRSVFLTGKAGTGKSTLLQTFFDDSGGKRIIKLAPTGVAALHIGGTTIHRFFGFPIDITLEKIDEGEFYMKRENRMLLKAADTIIIDEISMVRADLFDVINKFCKLIVGDDEPFGGKQIIMIGDLFQLPPVFSELERGAFTEKYQTEYFFSSQSYQELDPITIELDKVYRQTDQEFIGMLNAIRLGAHDTSTIEYFNNTCIDSFEELPAGTVVVTATKKTASMLNMQMLNAINAETLSRVATVKGKFPSTMFPNEQELRFKEGAQIMMIKNHKEGLRYNGTIGTIVEIKEDADGEEYVEVMIDDIPYEVYKEPRDIHEPSYNEKSQTIEYNPIGSFTQYPFKLGRAITIHKSQGLTFEDVCIDLGRGAFAQGQTYVALSRAKNYDGVYLNRPIQPTDIITDPRVIQFIGKATVPQKSALLRQAIQEHQSISFLYLDTKKGQIVRISAIKPFSVIKDTRKEQEFMVFTGIDYQGNTQKFSVRKMFEIQREEGDL